MTPVISHDDYTVCYDEQTGRIVFSGSLHLAGANAYRPIADFLTQILDSGVRHLTLDLKELRLLNSSGITTLSRFVISARQYPELQLVVRGSKAIFWQERSLGNLQRLFPTMELYLE
ncbi:MAG: slr1659 superfamily regulator [Pseudanabaenaceae cyanobacterium]